MLTRRRNACRKSGRHSNFVWWKSLGFTEKDAVQNAWEKVAESLGFAENGNFIRASSNWEYFEDSSS